MAPQPKQPFIKLRETIESLTGEIKAYESAIANVESLGRGKLPHVKLLQTTLEEMKARLQALRSEENDNK